MNGSTAGESDGKGFIVGVAERDDARLPFALQDLQRLMKHGTLDTTAAHRTRYFAIGTHSHRCAGISRARTLDLYHPSHRDALALLAPTLDIVQHFTHSITLPNQGAVCAR